MTLILSRLLEVVKVQLTYQDCLGTRTSVVLTILELLAFNLCSAATKRQIDRHIQSDEHIIYIPVEDNKLTLTMGMLLTSKYL